MLTLAAATLLGGLAAAGATAYAAHKSSQSSSQAINSSDSQFDKQMQIQDSQFKDQMAFLNSQHADQMDFANRQLADNTRIADQNFGLQQEAFNYQKELNATQMEREDSAIRRQVADYQAAGFSPLAAIGGSGAGSASLTSGSAPQYDMSGINAAAGQYADFARQYAQLKIAASQNYMNSKSQVATQHNASVLGARLSLAQMKADYMYKGASLAQQTFNNAVNARSADLNNQYVAEQLDYLKDKHKWENDNGYRDRSPVAAITNAVLDYIHSHGNGETTLEQAFDITKEAASYVGNMATEAAVSLDQHVAQKLKDSGVGQKTTTAVLFYLQCVKKGLYKSSFGAAVGSIYELGRTAYMKMIGK